MVRAMVTPQLLCRYPNLISSELGDRVGERLLHLYWRHRPEGLGKPSTFRKARVTIQKG